MTHSDEVNAGSRFEFGKNWANFLSVLDEDRILAAEKHLKDMLNVTDLKGMSFLDIGSGSGLSSLAARRLGARVHSFDYDPQCVACTSELKRRYYPDDTDWVIEEGSVLDTECMKSLGTFDIVYSWGVLHHTGVMWRALENAAIPVKSTGQLYIAIYNDQGIISKLWLRIKKLYCSGTAGKTITSVFCIPYFILVGLAIDVKRMRNPIRTYTEYKSQRGMSAFHDWFDWMGGLPFEVAKPDAITDFYTKQRLYSEKIVSCGNSSGNNEYIFKRYSDER